MFAGIDIASERHVLARLDDAGAAIGKPITITDPSMTRFMMTLADAVDLVLYAFEHGNNGDIFVQKAPAATVEVLTHVNGGTFRTDAGGNTFVKGVNLGLRDVAALRDGIRTAQARRADWAAPHRLERWARQRRSENATAAYAFDGINRLFSTDEMHLTLVRGPLLEELRALAGRQWSAAPTFGGTGPVVDITAPHDPSQIIGSRRDATAEEVEAAFTRAAAIQPGWDALGGEARLRYGSAFEAAGFLSAIAIQIGRCFLY